MKNKQALKEKALKIIQEAQAEMRDLNEAENQEIEEIKAEVEAPDEGEEIDVDEVTVTEDGFVVEEPKEEERSIEAEEKKEEPVEAPVEERKLTNDSNITKTKMKKEFRLLGAIRDIANNRNLDEVSKAVSAQGAEEMRKSGLSFGGQIQLPIESRTITVATEHDDIIETDFTDILAPLRAKNVLVEAGAKYLSNLVGDVQVPIMGKTNCGWAGEIAEAASGDPSFNHVTLSPKRLTAYIDLSKQFLAQDSLGAENMIREDIVKAINNKLEETILGAENGTTTQPEGMFNAISATSVSGFSDIVALEAELEDANVYGEKVYLMSNKAKAALRAMAKSSKVTQLVYENGAVDGTKAINTSMIAGKKYLYGDFSNLAVGQWGAIDLTVDPYTLARSGQVRLVVNCYFDAKILRPEAFVAGSIA